MKIGDEKNLDRQAVRLRNFTIKVTKLTKSGEHLKFRKIFEKVGMPLQGFEAIFQAEEWLIKLSMDKRLYPLYHLELKKIAGLFDFSKEEEKSLEMYLLTGGPLVLSHTSLLTKFEKNLVTGDRELYVRIIGDTRLEDIKREWFIIGELQKQLPDYKKPQKPWSKFFIHKKVVELYGQLGSAKRVADEMVKLRDDVGWQDYWDETRVWRIVSDYKKRLGKKIKRKFP